MAPFGDASGRLPTRTPVAARHALRRRGRPGHGGLAMTGATEPWARLEAHENRFHRGHARDEEWEGHHVKGPVVHRQQEDDHADERTDIGVHRFRIGVGPALHQGGQAGREVGGDRGRNRQDAVAGHEPDDRADQRDHAARIVHRPHLPHRGGVVERTDEDQQRHEAHHEGRQGTQAGALPECDSGGEQGRDSPQEPRHPVGLRRSPQGVPQVYGGARRAD